MRVDATYHIAFARDAMAMLALFAGWLELRGRAKGVVLAAIAIALLGAGFWSAALGRPYGLFVDPAITRWVADVSVARWAGGTERFLAGEPGAGTVWRTLTQRLAAYGVASMPSVLPPIVLVAVTALVATLWEDRRRAALAAALWVAGATGDLDAVRGAGLLPQIWARPGRSLIWISGIAIVLVVTRLGKARPRVAGVIGMATIVAVAAGGRHTLGRIDLLLLATLDQAFWLPAAAVGLARGRDLTASLLTAGGAAGLMLCFLGAPFDFWTAAACYRLGLVLAATRAIDEGSERAAALGWVQEVARRLGGAPERALAGGVLALLLAGSFVAWWDPAHTDALAKESLEPIAPALAEATAWVRDHTPPDSVFLAHEDYAPAVAALGGRRVLRAPTLLTAPDDERRLRLERAVLTGRAPESLRQRYGLRYVLIAPGQFTEYGLDAPDRLAEREALHRVYSNEKGMQIYEIGAGSTEGIQ